jgi:hypothetical protein
MVAKPDNSHAENPKVGCMNKPGNGKQNKVPISL